MWEKGYDKDKTNFIFNHFFWALESRFYKKISIINNLTNRVVATVITAIKTDEAHPQHNEPHKQKTR